MSEPRLSDLVEVAVVDTVVRLDGAGGRLAELVLTGDVVQSLSSVLEAAGQADGNGAGFFVVGPFGSGKSHFLAAAGELLAHPSAADGLDGWDGDLRKLAGAARPAAVVSVPLVEYRSGAALEDVVAERAWAALGRPSPDAGTNRLAAWDAYLGETLAAGHQGVVVLLDELSEFLRAKQGPALTEDLRFLQFLGEWAGSHPVVVLAALQESIEEVANVSQRELARIRDRYRPSLTLSMRHVEDLVRGRLVKLRPEAGPFVERAWTEITAAFPDADITRERFTRCYPLHPDTLTVLEGLRFVLSQQRGVVDFICTRLRQCLDRGYAALVTPDDVFDHFRGRLHERAETARLADTVVPYVERSADELVDAADRELTLRTVKLLCVLAASPLERPRTAAELAYLLLARMSDLDPSANPRYLEHAVLLPLVERGAYVVADPGPPRTYTVEVDADAALVARARVAQARADTAPGDRRLVATLVELGSSAVLPLQLLGEVGVSRREFLWQNTLRAMVIGTARVLETSPDDARAAVDRARATEAEGCLLIGEVELVEWEDASERAATLVRGNDRLAVWMPAALLADEREALLDVHARRQVLDTARREGRADVVEVLKRAADADASVAREILRRCYFDGCVHSPGPPVDLPSLAGLPFERQLPNLADPLLTALHPRHRDIAPAGELVGDRIVRQLLNEVIGVGRLGAAAVARGQLRPLVQGYLVPLGLARLRNDGVILSPDPARSPAVAEALRLVGGGEPVPAAEVVRGLADGPVGLTMAESLLVLNACVQAGLLEAWRGRRRLPEPFAALTGAERLGAGELVEPAVRATVARLAGICGPGPFEPWTAGVQRSAWDYAKAWLEARREDLAQVRSGLERFGEVPALAGADPGPVLDDVGLVGAVVDACPPSLLAADGLRLLVASLDDHEVVVVAARRLGAVARFARDELRRVEECAAYLTHPDLTIPDDDEGLGAAHAAVVGLVRQTLGLAAEDRVAHFSAAYREFRSAYLAAYQAGHDRYYAAVQPSDLDTLRAAPAYRALAALSSIGAIAVPDDRVKVDRLLAGAVPEPCRRRVDVEIGWKPRCACGYALGDKEPILDHESVAALAERGVRQHLAELARPEHQSRLAEASTDLAALGHSELAGDAARLAAMAAASPGEVDADAVASLLQAALAGVVRDVLTGGQLIVTRDLAALREDLIGRRYPKRRLLELLAAWVDPTGEVPPGGFVEVVDSAEATGPGRRVGGATAPVGPGQNGAGDRAPSRASGGRHEQGGTEAFLAARFPGLAALLPERQAADAFWLAAWWAGRPSPPAWLPARLLADPERLQAAADAARGDLTALAELADLDQRVGADSVLGDQMAAALDLGGRAAAEVAEVLVGEALLRYPLRLATEQFVCRMSADWQLASLLDGVDGIAAGHALVAATELAPLVHLIEVARHLAAAERALGAADCRTLVEDVYPVHLAPVPGLLSAADLACASPAVVSPDAVAVVRQGAARLLDDAARRFRAWADQGFPGCLPVWDIGASVVGPLLAAHGRVAVLLVDAMRADVAERVVALVSAALPDRAVHRRWAVVPAPPRTAESLAAMRLGRAVPAGSVPGHPGDAEIPFAHLGYEGTVLVGADRDHRSAELRDLWASGPPLSVAVATGVDERLHRTSVEPAALLDEATVALGRRVVPSLAAIPAGVPLVLLADHGFRENPSWGKGPEGRYVHGGTSLEECVIPIAIFDPSVTPE